ncbi:MAG: MFS transporter, partial [Ottowia sp.]|nr:MFS transporter [Ottowia sp.]
GAMLAASLTLDGLGSAALGGVSVVLLALAAIAALMGYIRHARRAPAPLFSPRLLDERSFRIGLMGNLAARLGAGAMPYLLPLLLQLRLERSPLESGLSLLPMALAAILARPLANGVIGRLGYRRTLVGNTVLLGVIVASFAFMAYGVLPQPLALGLLALLGAANSLQFTAMNTSALKDLSPAVAASGNSLFSMLQMLGMSLGVSCGALLLHAYSALLGAGSAAAFAATLVTAGALTALSALIFRRLD